MFSQEPSPDEWDVIHGAVRLACNFHAPARRRYPIVKGTIQQQEWNPSYYEPKKILFQLDNCHLRTKLQVLQIFVVCQTLDSSFPMECTSPPSGLYIHSLPSTMPLVMVMAIDNPRKQYFDSFMPKTLLSAAEMMPSTWKFEDKTKTHKYESLKVNKKFWYEVLPTDVSIFKIENKIHILEK